MAAGPGMAEQAANGDSDIGPVSKPGFHLAGLRIRPTLSLSARYDDNVFTTADNERSDWLVLVSPQTRVDWTGDAHRLQVELGAELGRYDTYDREDFDDWWVDVDGRYDLNEQIQLSGGLGMKYSHEPRDSQDAQIGGLEPTTFRTIDANAGIKWRLGEWTCRMGVTFETLDFDDVPGIGGSIINSDRDRDLLGLGLRASYRVDPMGEWFVQGLIEDRRYQRTPDQFGFDRDSDGYRLGAGFKGRLGQGGEVEAFVGLMSQDYDDPRFSSINKADFGGRLEVSPSVDTTLSLTLQRSLNETTDPGSPGYLHTELSGRLARKRTSRLQPYLTLGYSESDYLETGRDDRQLSAGAGLRYFLTRSTAVNAGFNYLERDSNDKGMATSSDDFEKNQFFIGLTSQLYPFNQGARR